MPDAAKVNSLFGRIAPRYDIANRFLSLGIDQFWRNRLVDEVEIRNPMNVADLATGSGDVAFALSQALPPSSKIKAFDFCGPMIEQAKIKQAAAGDRRIEFGIGDILALPIETSWADAVTISFGYRNLEDRAKGLREINRILKRDSGNVFILEFSQPYKAYRPFYYFYLKTILPTFAALVTGDKAAYRYLSDSIENFPDREGVSRELLQAGFSSVCAIPLALGSVALHIGKT